MTSRRGLAILIASLLEVGVTAPAGAAPLSLSEVHELNTWVQCTEGCPPLASRPTYDEQTAHFACLAACGSSSRLWEKNGVAPVDRRDLELALLEAQDEFDPHPSLVCYRGADDEIVVPGALCTGYVCEASPACTAVECARDFAVELQCTEEEPGGPRCWWPADQRPPACPDVVCTAKPTRSADDCRDQDGDGLPAWLERHKKTSDTQAAALCGGNAPCAFDHRCDFSVDLGAGICVPRTAGEGSTVFHLELVAEDDQQVLVWVYYDYSPIPARVLDLHIVYDDEQLTLADARPLPSLALFGKQLVTTRLADGSLRVAVLDPGSSSPIQTGPIVELAFQRLGDAASSIRFDTTDANQVESMAPLQGDRDNQAALANDGLWGSPVAAGARGDADTRLLLWYGFESAAAPLAYSNIPGAEELCGVMAECANEEDPTLRAKLVAKLAALQTGELTSSTAIEGVTGNAVFLDGHSDHLRLPVQYQQPLEAGSQSFSFFTWFYTEGNSSDERKDTPQILFSHNGFDERTRFGLELLTGDDSGMDLVFFAGDLLAKTPRPVYLPVARNLAKRVWHQAGMTVDATSGEVVLYLDGKRTASYRLSQPPAAVSCPQFDAGTNVLVH
ncbi:MAG: hypothetical protein V2A73_02225, partial [Pseudomonadota bacterium]